MLTCYHWTDEHLYWRVRFPNGPGTGLAVSELALYAAITETAFGTNIMTSGNGSESSHEGTHDYTKALNLDWAGSYWQPANGSGVNSWLKASVAALTPVEEIYLAFFAAGQTPPDEIILEWSDDNTTWNSAIGWPTHSGLNFNTNEEKWLRRSGPYSRVSMLYETATLTGNSNGWTGFTQRQVITNARMCGRDTGGGNAMSISFKSGSGEGLVVTKAYVGIKGAGTYDFAGTPTPITFDGGSAGFSIAANTEKFSDVIPITIGASDALVVSTYTTTGQSANDTFRSRNGFVTSGYKSGDTAADVTVSGYTSNDVQRYGMLKVYKT